MTRGKSIAVLLAAALVLAAGAAFAQDKADQVKSVFLFKFFDYVTWPDGQGPGSTGDGLLCTYGPHAFGEALSYIASKKGGGFRVQSVATIEDGDSCHILYVARSKYGEIARLPADSGVLTVGDASGFLESGGVIQMKEDEGRVALVIDLRNARKSGVRVSSRLLDIAEVRK